MDFFKIFVSGCGLLIKSIEKTYGTCGRVEHEGCKGCEARKVVLFIEEHLAHLEKEQKHNLYYKFNLKENG